MLVFRQSERLNRLHLACSINKCTVWSKHFPCHFVCVCVCVSKDVWDTVRMMTALGSYSCVFCFWVEQRPLIFSRAARCACITWSSNGQGWYLHDVEKFTDLWPANSPSCLCNFFESNIPFLINVTQVLCASKALKLHSCSSTTTTTNFDFDLSEWFGFVTVGLCLSVRSLTQARVTHAQHLAEVDGDLAGLHYNVRKDCSKLENNSLPGSLFLLMLYKYESVHKHTWYGMGMGFCSLKLTWRQNHGQPSCPKTTGGLFKTLMKQEGK